MTNYEDIKSMSIEDMARRLCQITDDCNTCVASDYCVWGHSGYIDWLNEEVE